MPEAGKAPEASPKWPSSPDISADIRAASQRVVAESHVQGSSVGTALNNFLRQYLPWPYQVNGGRAFDAAGAESQRFESLIYAGPNSDERVAADNLACAIDAYEKIGIGQLRDSYQKIALVKSLAKRPAPNVSSDVPIADATMGIIFALNSDLSIETLGSELAQLNREHDFRLWPDILVVLSLGTVNLACQFPYQKLGDFLPPARGVLPRTAMYIHVFARAHAPFALNKMCGVLFPYLYFFDPGVGSPPYRDILKDMPATGMAMGAFQFNLSGKLVPVPTSMRFDELFLFPLSFRVEDKNGNIHAKVQYLPWQDGGVVRVQGQMPIEMLLAFAGRDAVAEPIVRFQGEQTSGVIRMSRDQFKQMANRVARQSNLVIKPDRRPNLVIHKRGDEGTSSPFVARIFLGLCVLRDEAVRDKSLKEEFDETFEPIVFGLESLRDLARAIDKLYRSHANDVQSGQAARLGNGDIYIDAPIDGELGRLTESFINTGSRIVKERMKTLLKTLDVNIGFLFQRDGAFANGVTRLRPTDPTLADYLVATRRNWSNRLITIRNDMLEHGTWSLPVVRHQRSGEGVCAIEPMVEGQPVTEFVTHVWDRICCFVEELSTHALQKQLSRDVSVTEIPLKERAPKNVARFRIALVGGGTPIWRLAYHETKFEDT